MHVGICNMHVETRHLFLMLLCAGDALDPRLWKIPNKALSHSVTLSLCSDSVLPGSGSRLMSAGIGCSKIKLFSFFESS